MMADGKSTEHVRFFSIEDGASGGRFRRETKGCRKRISPFATIAQQGGGATHMAQAQPRDTVYSKSCLGTRAVGYCCGL